MNLPDRLFALADRLMATTEHHQYAQLVIEAATELRSRYVSRAPNVDGRDFYELCQAYRHSKEIMPHPSMPNTVQAFANLQEYIKTGKLPWESYEQPGISVEPSTKERP